MTTAGRFLILALLVMVGGALLSLLALILISLYLHGAPVGSYDGLFLPPHG